MTATSRNPLSLERFQARFPRVASLASLAARAARRTGRVAGRAGGVLPITPLGAVVIPLLAWLTWTFGIGRQDRIILSLAAVGLGWSALAICAVGLAGVCLRLRPPVLPLQPLTIEAGSPTLTGLSCSRFTWALFFRLECRWVEPGGIASELIVHDARLAEQVTATERTTADRVVRSVRISDPLGLAAVSIRLVSQQPVVVLPDAGQADRLPMPVVQRTDDIVSNEQGAPEGDLAEIRRYAAGDPLKRILWKTFARTRQVLVRMPERAVAPTNKTNYFFVAAEGDEPAAGVARAILERRAADEEFSFAVDGVEAPATTIAEALECLAGSRHARQSGAADLPVFLAGAEAAHAACVLFVPPKPGAWLERVAGQLAARPDGCQVVIGFDGAPPRQSAIARLLTRQQARPAASRDELRHVYRQFSNLGAEVRVVDRRSGDELEPTELEV